jgi:hypothetical protein
MGIDELRIGQPFPLSETSSTLPLPCRFIQLDIVLEAAVAHAMGAASMFIVLSLVSCDLDRIRHIEIAKLLDAIFAYAQDVAVPIVENKEEVFNIMPANARRQIFVG